MATKAKTTEKERLIEKITYKRSNQSLGYRELYEFKGLKFKIEICADSVNFQSYARISVLKDLEWTVIYTIPYAEMNTDNDIAYCHRYSQDVRLAEPEFREDVIRLKKITNELI